LRTALLAPSPPPPPTESSGLCPSPSANPVNAAFPQPPPFHAWARVRCLTPPRRPPPAISPAAVAPPLRKNGVHGWGRKGDMELSPSVARSPSMAPPRRAMALPAPARWTAMLRLRPSLSLNYGAGRRDRGRWDANGERKKRVIGGGPTRRCRHRPSSEKAGIATALYLVNNSSAGNKISDKRPAKDIIDATDSVLGEVNRCRK
jgi:hypothetical protein